MEKMTWLELSAKMIAQGWRSAGPGKFEWHHENGRIVRIDLFAEEEGHTPARLIWHRYAESNTTPEPF